MIKAVVAKGGGVRGYAYAGAFQVLEQYGVSKNLECTCGTSAGSLFALMVGLKYTAAEIKTMIGSLNFSSLESGWNIFRELSDEGLYSNAHLLAFINSIVTPKLGPNATFADMKKAGFLDYRCIASIPATQNIQVFSIGTTPDKSIAMATLASASIPGVFPKVRIPGIDYDLVDGGLIENFGITTFDKELQPSEVLGLYVYNFTQSKPLPTANLPQMTIACFESALSSQDIIDMGDPATMNRTIVIDTLGISSTDFSITQADKDRLFQAGVDATTKYLQAHGTGNA